MPLRHAYIGICAWKVVVADENCDAPGRQLKPGGWIEVQDMGWRYGCDDGTMKPGYKPIEMMEAIRRGLAEYGTEVLSTEKKLETLVNAGFTNIDQLNKKVPIGPWTADKKLHTAGLLCRTVILDGLQAMMMGPLTRGLGWKRDEVERFSVSVQEDLIDLSIHSYRYFHAVWAQKPLVTN